MRNVPFGLSLVMVNTLGASAEDRKEMFDAAKLIGTWEFQSASPGEKATITFSKEGTFGLTLERNGKIDKIEGTYTLAGATLIVVRKQPDGEVIKKENTVTKLTDNELETKSTTGKDETLKKINPKK